MSWFDSVVCLLAYEMFLNVIAWCVAGCSRVKCLCVSTCPLRLNVVACWCVMPCGCSRVGLLFKRRCLGDGVMLEFGCVSCDRALLKLVLEWTRVLIRFGWFVCSRLVCCYTRALDAFVEARVWYFLMVYASNYCADMVWATLSFFSIALALL